MNERTSFQHTFDFGRVVFLLVVTLLFFLPIKNALVFSVGYGPISVTTPAKILGVVTAVLWSIYKLFNTYVELKSPVVLFLLFCAWAICSLLWVEEGIKTVNQTPASLQALQYVIGIVFLFIIWDSNKNIKRVDLSTTAIVLGGCILISWTLLGSIDQALNATGAEGYGSRHGGGGYGGNNVANLIVLIVPFIWYLIGRVDKYVVNNRTQKLTQTVLIGYILMAGIAVLLTGSRQGIVGYVICLSTLFYAVLRYRSSSDYLIRYVKLLSLTVLSLIVLVFLPQLEPVRKRLNSVSPTLFSPLRRVSQLPDMLATGNLSNRLPTWRHVFEEFLSDPVIGSGISFFEADNIFISTLANLGIVGFLLLTIPIIILFRDNVRLLFSTGTNEHALAFLLAWGFMAGLNNWGNSPVVWALLGLIISQTYVLSRIKNVYAGDMQYNSVNFTMKKPDERN